MVLTKQELNAALQKEVRILLHLAGKLKGDQGDYRPTPKQRSALELLRYLSVMGPVLVSAARNGAFDGALWQSETAAAETRNLRKHRNHRKAAGQVRAVAFRHDGRRLPR